MLLPLLLAVDVALQTTLGTIVLRLDQHRAPVTTANFLRYVDGHRYDGAAFYRAVPEVARAGGRPTISVIQGGLETKLGDAGVAKLPTIPIEPTTKTGLSNLPGTIAMARSTDPNSASSEFFINVADDTMLDAQRFRDGAGYAVFGRVVRGMDVVRTILDAPARPDPVMSEILTPPVTIVRAYRVR